MRLEYVWYALLPAVPAAAILDRVGAGPAATFLVAGLGIVPLAAFMGRATDALAGHVGPRFGGLISASFGNAAELILALFAIQRGLPHVVKASLTGSIIGNALFVLGLSLVAGGVRNGRQRFDRLSIGLRSTLLVLAGIGLTIPSVLYHALGPAAEVRLSVEVAGVLFTVYVLDLLHSLLASGRRDADEVQRRGAEKTRHDWGARRAAVVLVCATAAVAYLAEILVGAIEQARTEGYLAKWGMSEVFVGFVPVALIGNAAENSAAVQMAYRNKIDLAIHIALGRACRSPCW